MIGKSRRFVTVCLLISVALLAGTQAFAERKKLKEPPIAQFNAEEYLSGEYKANLDQLKEVSAGLGDAELPKNVEALLKNTRKDKSEKILEHIERGLKKYEKSKPDSYKKAEAIIKELKEAVKENRFNKGHTGIDFAVDKNNRKYDISFFDTDKGQEITKHIPMPPVMDVTVEADVATVNREGREFLVYQYWLGSSMKSNARIRALLLESKFSKDYIQNSIISELGKSYSEYMLAPKVESSVRYPSGLERSYFILRIYDYRKIKGVSAGIIIPGNQSKYPYELEVRKKELPGILNCYIELFTPDYLPWGDMNEEDPGMARDIFTRTSDVLGFTYHTPTIGPVPIPDPFERDAFIDKIISYNEQSIEEGWNDHPPVIKFTRDGLAKIKGDPSNRKRIEEFIAELEGYYRKDKILSEAYALLKYNLEYLMGKM